MKMTPNQQMRAQKKRGIIVPRRHHEKEILPEVPDRDADAPEKIDAAGGIAEAGTQDEKRQQQIEQAADQRYERGESHFSGG